LSQKRSIARSTLFVLVANGVSSVLGLLRGFYTARLLSPGDYGAWTLISSLLSYTNYADVGINTGFILEAPRLIGRGHLEQAQHVQQQVYTITLLICGTLAGFGMAIAFLPLPFTASQMASLRIVASAVLILALLNYYHVVARIQDRFDLISLSTVVAAAVATAGIVAVATMARSVPVELVALTAVLGSGAAALSLGIGTRPALAWPPDGDLLRRLIRLGLPVSLLPIAFTLFQSVDRWVVAMLAPAEDMGHYGLGTTLGLFLYMVPSTLAIVLFTRQIERFGATNDPRALEPLVSLPMRLSGYIMGLVAGSVALAMPFIIYYVVPAYWPGRRAAVMQLIGNCLLFAVPVGSHFLISSGRQHQVFGALAAGLVFESGLVAVLVQTGWRIDGAAFAVMVSDAMYSGFVIFLTVRLFVDGFKQRLGRVLSCFAPFAVCLSVTASLGMADSLSGDAWNDLVGLAVRIVIYFVTCGSLLLAMAWRSGLLQESFIVDRATLWMPSLTRLLNEKEKRS